MISTSVPLEIANRRIRELEAELAQAKRRVCAHHTVRITGPGIDHQVLITSEEDFEALEAILAKIRKHFASQTGDRSEGVKGDS